MRLPECLGSATARMGPHVNAELPGSSNTQGARTRQWDRDDDTPYCG
jgi:hypothetical protein